MGGHYLVIVVNLPLNEGRQAKFVVRRSFNPPPPPRTLTFFSLVAACHRATVPPAFLPSSSSSLPSSVCVCVRLCVCVSAGRRLVFQKHTHMHEMQQHTGLTCWPQESASQHTGYKR